MIVCADRETYCGMLRTRRDGRVTAFTRIGTDVTASPSHPAWMSVSIVYV